MKKSLDDLALFGGVPEFDAPLHVGRPNIPDQDRLHERFRGVLQRRWLTNDGPLVREFETRVAELAGAEHCVAVANGTLGLEIASRALDLDGEVIVPAFTFVATAHALRWQRIRPVFADIDPATHLMSLSSVTERLTSETSAIVPVHLWGQACDPDAISELAGERGLKVLYDGSHAFHATHRGQPIGGFGNATVFSFHATKFINCFEGGAVTTNEAALAERMRSLRNFGFSGYDQVDYLGINGKMNEVSAAMGLGCLESLDDFVAANRCNFEAYVDGLTPTGRLQVLPSPAAERSNYQYVVAELSAESDSLTRDQLYDLLWNENVRVRRYFYPGCHRMEPYASEQRPAPRLPVTDAVCSRVLQFPTGTAITVEEVQRVCRLVSFLLDNAAAIRQRFENADSSGGSPARRDHDAGDRSRETNLP